MRKSGYMIRDQQGRSDRGGVGGGGATPPPLIIAHEQFQVDFSRFLGKFR